ncbi:MAG: short-chain dehydrogenase [Myxococcales bacterium]|nr:short-chain dehydrogenase [Myxococcales bacterium]|tara:strand:+ start:491 stop:1201 length:711 start_codon:yes stop_codon:yes gene_type:complete
MESASSPLELKNRHVVVTGGTGALGRAVVQAVVEAGAICTVPSSRDSITPPWDDHPNIRLVPKVDLCCEESVVQFYAGLDSLWASIHVAGGFSMSAIADTSLKTFQDMFRKNAITAFLCCREATVRMRESGDGGRIVNIAARTVEHPAGGMVAYTTAKDAVASMTRNLAEELRSESIEVNAILPSIIDTPANREAMPDADFSCWPTPEEIAQEILQMVSPQNQPMTGHLVGIYGDI